MWEEYGDLFTGKRRVLVRSVKIREETGKIRRMRICTVWDPFAETFTKTPCLCRLVKLADGKICCLITGQHTGYVKIGRRLAIQSLLFTPLNTISKKARNLLTKSLPLVFEEIDGNIVGFER
ncbi:MAG: hypothetical protein WDA18_00955 [Candidatus Ratteibacteria bacterium]